MNTQIAPYGTWKSPIAPKTLTERTVSITQVRLDGPDIYWVEDNPRRPGNSVLLRRDALGQTREALPMIEGTRLVNVSTKVHERGGRAYAVRDGHIVVSDGLDGRVYGFRVSDRSRTLTPLTQLANCRYGDFEIDLERGVVYAVVEDHRNIAEDDERGGVIRGIEPTNSLVAIPLDGSATRDPSHIKTVFEGTDFVSSPTLSPCNGKLAWLTWNHPEMPWTKSELHAGDLDPFGQLTSDIKVVDRPDVCAYEPRWTLDGDLVHVDDSTGWANFYRTEGFRVRKGEPKDAWRTRLRTRALHPGAKAFSKPHWQLGLHSFDNLDEEHLVCSWAEGSEWHLGTIRLDNGLLEEWEVGWEPIGNVGADSGRVVFLGGKADKSPAIIEVRNSKARVVRPSSETVIPSEWISSADDLTWTNRDGSTGYGLYYPPRAADIEVPEGAKPPLLVFIHDRPTMSARDVLDPRIQYWTSRGFGVLEPNPRGSTGRGRDYREALSGHWGQLDVDDTIDGVNALVEQGRVDAERVAIRGASFGALTVMFALEKSDAFTAGVIASGVTHFRELTRALHKFESHYPQRLFGIDDFTDPDWLATAPMRNLDTITAPILIMHGTDDEFIPVGQAEDTFHRLDDLGKPVALELIPDEGHTFTHDRSIELALKVELAFYGKVWGIEVDQDLDLYINNF